MKTLLLLSLLLGSNPEVEVKIRAKKPVAKVKVPELKAVLKQELQTLQKSGFGCTVLQDRSRNLGFMACVSPNKRDTFGSMFVFTEGVWALISSDFESNPPTEL